ncbi:MAG: hypothetical protein A3G32_09475 [Deltaproteobacteria bacterium RIFCSPLOWO2_12_FULL_40_28]|nr:MAG: hypothetical protein A3C45_07745 [Deltaproteobacteria bacterium RIFCSPHIGHO2_02_FULL_40_28]OGQ20512.1 MAG: hypothetical protein A3E27_02535 [Deltaproteobacteria bacterium RIFCSPHIGHO2_12_FULL_40_32]OGQ41163.1 MAG: hypothetical protein A3I69_07770 [Deltaproteobacteria bacterium RIFCSPLOWO2_02_FULL_40_36]OGQ55125.1 MAG: hypothetical protein A3G32_09475 [Deltaproteobacteria bacterium RIFCSPLOWO2_12_FULL_40_28]
MEGQNVTVYLNTPLLVAEKNPHFPPQLFRLKGKLTEWNEGGILLNIKEIGDEKSLTKVNQVVLIPLHKVDHIVAD